MQGQMGSQGPRANPFMTSDQNSSRPGNSMQGPSGHNVGHDAFMTSRQNAQPQGGPVHRPTSSSYPASGRVAQPQELPVMDPRLTAPREPIIPVWYPAENNWNMCIQQMAETFRHINQEFTGQWSEEQILVKETNVEKAGDLLYNQSGGRLGQKYKPSTRTAEVKDVFQDFAFPPSERSWYRGGEAHDLHELKPPAQWIRLQELVMDVPYPTVSPANGGFVPRAGRVYQGALEDFYLVAGLQTLGMKPQLISSIFADMDFSNPSLGVFTLRLHKHGQWHHVVVDGALPFDKNMNPLCCHGEFFPGFAWPSIIEKAYAKLHGSWEALGGGGHVEEVLTDLTGGCSTRFGTMDVAGDRLWQYLHTMQHTCVFGCNINEGEFSKRNIPIDQHWAASIFRVEKFQDVPYICVCIAAPVFTVRHMPACHVPSAEGYGIHDGFVWLQINDFTTLFDTIYECRLMNSDLGPPQLTGIPYSPGWVHGAPWFEEMWAFQGDVYTETAPSFLFEIKDAPNEITMEVSQTDLRYGDAHADHEYGRPMQAPLLLRFYQCSPEVSDRGGGEIYMVHLSAWGHTRDASLGVKVMRPGKYLAQVSIPAKYVCHRMIFRTYSTLPLAIKPITQHRSWIAVNPAMPLNAMPFSLCGFQRIDALSEKLPQMFDEAQGRGKPLANSQLANRFGQSEGGGFLDMLGLGPSKDSNLNNPMGLR
ncbi:unnamed protein product, partial [Polarella glacialis]